MDHLASFLKPDPSGVLTECALNSCNAQNPSTSAGELVNNLGPCEISWNGLSWNFSLARSCRVSFHPHTGLILSQQLKGTPWQISGDLHATPSSSFLCLADHSKGSLPSLLLSSQFSEITGLSLVSCSCVEV